MFAGRNLSASHIAFASARVMGTCGIMGQAVGTAASVAIKHGLMPRETGRLHIHEIQTLLQEDDCFLPHIPRNIPEICKDAKWSSSGDTSALLNGIDRTYGGVDNGYFGKLNIPIVCTFPEKRRVSSFRLVVDSDLEREYMEGNPNLMKIPMPLFFASSYEHTSFGFPTCVLKEFTIDILDDKGEWKTVFEATDNIMRLICGKIDAETTAVRLVPKATWHSSRLYHTYGSGKCHIFAFEVK